MTKIPLVLLAGGHGQRLKIAEDLPKPLVDVNGSPLIARVANQLLLSNIISDIFILCSDVNLALYENILKSNLCQSFALVTESQKTGRFGAIQNFVLDNSTIGKFLVANADTMFSKIDPQIFSDIDFRKSNPIVFLGFPDQHRDDFAKVDPILSAFSSSMQNSGLAILSRDWVLNNKQQLPCDLDQLILNSESNYIDLKASIYDGGTPVRLQQIRQIFK